jgi:hypothetical protein
VKRRDNVFETPPAGAEAPLDLMAVLMADFPIPKFTGVAILLFNCLIPLGALVWWQYAKLIVSNQYVGVVCSRIKNQIIENVRGPGDNLISERSRRISHREKDKILMIRDVTSLLRGRSGRG